MATAEHAMDMPQYPLRLDVEYPDRLSRWLIFVKWLLAFPHYVVLIGYAIAAWVCAIIAFFAILFTGRLSPGLWDFIFGYSRWSLRVSAYVALMRDEYPPFTNQPSSYPARIECERPDQQSRLLVLIKWLFVIPHWIVLIFLGLAAVVVLIIAWFAILFTARFPRGLFDFVEGVIRWQFRVQVYCGILSAYNPYVGGLLRDEYPPFSLK